MPPQSGIVTSKRMNFISVKILLSIFLSIQQDFAYVNWGSVQDHLQHISKSLQPKGAWLIMQERRE